jgi:hypothetical protein
MTAPPWPRGRPWAAHGMSRRQAPRVSASTSADGLPRSPSGSADLSLRWRDRTRGSRPRSTRTTSPRVAACGPDVSTAQSWYHDSILRQKLQDSVGPRGAPLQGLQARITDPAPRRTGPTAGRCGPLPRCPWPHGARGGGRLHLVPQPRPRPSTPKSTVARHTHNLPPEVRSRGGEHGGVQRYMSEAPRATPVDLPRCDDERSNLRLVGARVWPASPTATRSYLIYDQRGARISLFANPKRGAPVVPASFSAGFGEREAHGLPSRSAPTGATTWWPPGSAARPSYAAWSPTSMGPSSTASPPPSTAERASQDRVDGTRISGRLA